MPTGGDKVILKNRSGPEAVYWCKACYAEEYEEIHGKPLSANQFKQLSARASGRPFLTSKGIAKSALFKLTADRFGAADTECLNKMRQHFAAGLDAAAMEKFNEHVKDVTEKSTFGRGVLEYAAIHDYNPMISRTFAMRYACRQRDCGFVPKSEADWIIATQQNTKREY